MRILLLAIALLFSSTLIGQNLDTVSNWRFGTRITSQIGGRLSPGMHYSIDVTLASPHSTISLGLITGKKTYTHPGAGLYPIAKTNEVKGVEVIYQYCFGSPNKQVRFFLENTLNGVNREAKGIVYNPFEYPKLIKFKEQFISNMICPGLKINLFRGLFTSFRAGVGITIINQRFVFTDGNPWIFKGWGMDFQAGLSIGYTFGPN